MEMAITKISSKGQVVIPVEMRTNLKEGDKFLIIQDEERYILKKISKLDKELEDDLKFAKKTDEAWKRYEKGEFKSMDAEDFLKEIEKW